MEADVRHCADGPLRLISVPLLGIHPTLQTLSAQAAVMMLSAFGL